MDPLPLDSILNKMKAQMKTDIQNFRRESKRVKKWEDKLWQNIQLISIANRDVRELSENQESLDRDITNIESDRKDLEDGLLELEERVKVALERSAPRYGDDENDEERRRIYRMAEDLAVHLESMDTTVGKLVSEFNRYTAHPLSLFFFFLPLSFPLTPMHMYIHIHSARGYSDDGDETAEDSDSFASINRILNNHHDCLAELEFESHEMSQDIRGMREAVRGHRHQQAVPMNY
jgi:hypothetical protein